MHITAYDIIQKKKNGKVLTKEEIQFAVTGFTKGEIPSYQMSALLMAVCLKGMNEEETADLTMAMAESGDQIDLSSIPGVKIDKHSTGGVGDKTTLLVAPMVASLGVPVAKMSGRGLGHTGGTIDKLEAIPGFRTSFSRDEFLDNMKKISLCIAGQSGNLAPADKKIYALRDVTATVDSIPLIASSIMSKKIAAGADCIVLDVKTGSGAFMKTEEDSLRLAQTMVDIGEAVGRKTIALITDMDIPLGNAIGNSLEVAEVCRTLQGNGPQDLKMVSIELAAHMLYLADKGTLEQCRTLAEDTLKSGQALTKLAQMVKQQGGNKSYVENPNLFKKSIHMLEVKSPQTGYIHHMDTTLIGRVACMLGAGREVEGGSIDYSAGLLLLKKTGDHVQTGETIAEFHYSTEKNTGAAQQSFLDSLHFSKAKPIIRPLILNTLGISE